MRSASRADRASHNSSVNGSASGLLFFGRVSTSSQADNGMQLIVAGMTGERFVVGKTGEIKRAATDPEPGRERERMETRDLRKPTVHITTERRPTIDIAETRRQLVALIRAHPGIAATLVADRPELRNVILIDTTAKVLPAAEMEPVNEIDD